MKYFTKPELFVLSLFLVFFSCKKEKTTIDIKTADYWYENQKYFVQGSIYEQMALDSAIHYNPKFSRALVEKSVSYNKRGDFETGFYYLNKAVDIDPEEHLGYRGFVKLYMLRDYQGALDDFLRLDSLTPNFRDTPWGEDIDKVIGLCYMKMGKFEYAKNSFDKSINAISRENGEDWVEIRTFLYRGIVDLELNKNDSAIYFFNQSLKYDRRFPEAYFYKARAFEKMNNRKNAQMMADSALYYFKTSGVQKNPYFELPYQVYLSDIKSIN